VGRPRLPDSPFWVEPEDVEADHLRLGAEESHHLLHVHRAREGAPFEATDGRGRFYECVLESAQDRAVGRIVRTTEDQGELPRGLELYVGLPEWRAVEQVIEHAVPLGASAIDFLPCERSGRDAIPASRLARLERVARAGIKQSRRSRLPRIMSSESLPILLKSLGPGDRLLADPEGRPLLHEITTSSQLPVQVAVGPPGGFAPEERRLLLESEFRPISLGPSRLTTETASLAVLALARNSLLRSKL
jgi:16S rRNA (uracil1498-N3)-methyltransferase